MFGAGYSANFLIYKSHHIKRTPVKNPLNLVKNWGLQAYSIAFLLLLKIIYFEYLWEPAQWGGF